MIYATLEIISILKSVRVAPHFNGWVLASFTSLSFSHLGLPALLQERRFQRLFWLGHILPGDH